MGIEGRVAVVTGAAGGIGRETARLFHAAGARLALADLAGADEVARELDPGGRTVLAGAVDVTPFAAPGALTAGEAARIAAGHAPAVASASEHSGTPASLASSPGGSFTDRPLNG